MSISGRDGTGRGWRLTGMALALALGLAPLRAEAQTAVPQPSESAERFGDWTLRCLRAPARDAAGTGDEVLRRVCEAVARVEVQADDGVRRPLIQISLGLRSDGDGLRLVLLVPREVHLRSPVRLWLGAPGAADSGGAWREATYLRCTDAGCIADTDLDPAEVAELVAAAQAQVGFVTIDARRIGVPLSLEGLEAALAGLAEKGRG